MDGLLLLLAQKGALDSPVRITTVEAGRALSMSQQNASVRMGKLEEAGLIERGEQGIRITGAGRRSLESAYSALGSVLRQKRFVFTGRVVAGFGRGKHFLSLPRYRERIRKVAGFSPYPGTLNLEIEEPQIAERIALREHKPLRVGGFKQGGKEYGPVDLYPCTIEGLEGAILFPYRSHHGLRILELISPHNLSRELGGKGGKIRVEVVFE